MPSGAGYVLDDPVAGLQALHVVLVGVHDESRLPEQGSPERIDVGLVPVHGTGTESGLMPKRQTAGP